MNFDDFWNRVEKQLDELRLETGTYKHPFTMRYGSNHTIEITPQNTRDTSTTTTISKHEFENAWKSVIGKMEQFKPKHYQDDFKHRASYIGPIMKHFLNGSEIE